MLAPDGFQVMAPIPKGTKFGKRKNTGTLAKFETHIFPEPNSGCWLWDGLVVASTGYAKFHVGLDKTVLAHRFSYMKYKGEIPKGLQVRHTCDVKICVNPDHLLLGTALDNAQDAILRNKYRRGERHAMAKLNKNQVLKIKESTATISEIARHFCISRMHVKRIKNSKSWSHL